MHMNEIIKCSERDSSVAFTHCISRYTMPQGFDDPRHMIADIAIKFRNKFGRLQLANIFNLNLTLQKTIEDAIVYGLVTKPRYFKKTTLEEYDQSFKYFTQGFKTRNLKALFVSALGCVSPKHFAQNISKSHWCRHSHSV